MPEPRGHSGLSAALGDRPPRCLAKSGRAPAALSRPQLRSATSALLRPPVPPARPIATLPTSSPTERRREDGAQASDERSLGETFPSAVRPGQAPLPA